MKNNTKKTAKKATMTLGELKTWLDGYCSAHGNDWSPTPEQWKLIRNKILSVTESRENQGYTAPVNQVIVRHPQQPHFEQPRTTLVEPQQFDTTMPQRESSVVGVTNRPAMIMHDGKLKTPDGTSGDTSSFA